MGEVHFYLCSACFIVSFASLCCGVWSPSLSVHTAHPRYILTLRENWLHPLPSSWVVGILRCWRCWGADQTHPQLSLQWGFQMSNISLCWDITRQAPNGEPLNSKAIQTYWIPKFYGEGATSGPAMQWFDLEAKPWLLESECLLSVVSVYLCVKSMNCLRCLTPWRVHN